jgi:hypothetical protein
VLIGVIEKVDNDLNIAMVCRTVCCAAFPGPWRPDSDRGYVIRITPLVATIRYLRNLLQRGFEILQNGAA